MTREEYRTLVKAMRGAYINCQITTQEIFDEWYALLKDIDYKTASRNLENHIKNNKFPPTIAELRGTDKKSFGNFPEREYKMEQLELALLGLIPGSAVQMIEEESQ